MHRTRRPDEKHRWASAEFWSYDRSMLTTNIETRTLTLVLLEDEWRALREAEPDPVAWLKEQVRERLERVEKSDDRARAGKAEEPAAADA